LHLDQVPFWISSCTVSDSIRYHFGFYRQPLWIVTDTLLDLIRYRFGFYQVPFCICSGAVLYVPGAVLDCIRYRLGFYQVPLLILSGTVLYSARYNFVLFQVQAGISSGTFLYFSQVPFWIVARTVLDFVWYRLGFYQVAFRSSSGTVSEYTMYILHLVRCRFGLYHVKFILFQVLFLILSGTALDFIRYRFGLSVAFVFKQLFIFDLSNK
jgi:hypothetical protein